LYFNGLKCSCTEPVTKPIKADTVFSISGGDSQWQKWDLSALSWHFLCGPAPGSPLLVSVSFGMADGENCNHPVVVLLPNESHPTGSFAQTCVPGMTVEATWDFMPK